jgi:hypothetical protein
MEKAGPDIWPGLYAPEMYQVIRAELDGSE